MEDLTSRATHLWRLLKWGRTLARHGALRGRKAHRVADQIREDLFDRSQVAVHVRQLVDLDAGSAPVDRDAQHVERRAHDVRDSQSFHLVVVAAGPREHEQRVD